MNIEPFNFIFLIHFSSIEKKKKKPKKKKNIFLNIFIYIFLIFLILFYFLILDEQINNTNTYNVKFSFYITI